MVRRVRARRTAENAARRWGFHRVAGCDEVGRGCLAGPVVAAAVVLDPARHIPGLADSKALTAGARERLYEAIAARALAWSVAAVPAAEIDALTRPRASLAAMQRAVMALAPLPDLVLVDRFHIPDLPLPQRGVPRGDRTSAAIAAASIMAKVTRDREMIAHDAADPRYGYARHKGYATAAHVAALAAHGYSPLHRRSFRPARLFDTIV
jgi:ribonuclease HII